ncbi:hypothetical protein NAEGRDRAFT_58778 [Naegleria gruberi]|uniref:DUF4116 domain-containing protein n=1 Tax=Naegleria gruberi TaxID=5762 RepID=D2VNT8_NAEGR|nr:uncharacterized protein NAEGRDRAFT_58778 [Naegleria gruberi]EFC41472.1 hypothetical protein NAEGRDRAFT_58778 [Naegleria gruberi]|eukprot:XP_002674216.1 hypothetical protein NAEGRDRAFT_58778 [Naegleria gruberi strain NEG-M]
MRPQVTDDNYFSDVYLVTREGDQDQHNDEIIHNLFKSLLKLMKKISHSRSLHLTNENVQYLRMAVRVKRRSASELSKLESKYENDRLFAWLAVRSFGTNALKTIRNEKFKCDREIIKAGLESDGSILFACTIPREELREDEELILKGLETCPRVLELANDRIRNDRSVVESVLKRDGMQLKYCGESIKNDRNIIGIALKQNIESCKFIPAGIVDEQLVFRVVLINGLLLVHFPEFNSNRKVVIAAVKQNGLALEFASNELRSDEEIVKLAMETQKDALLFASPTLLIRKEFMDNLVSKMIDWRDISFKISEIIKKYYSDYEEFMLSRYERGYEYPTYLSNSLSIDNWIRILAKNINLFRPFLEYYSKSKELVKDVSFLLKLAQKMKIDADFKESYSDYLELQKAMILKQPYLLYHFDPSLKSDLPLMFRILRETSLYIDLKYFDKSLLENREFLLEVLKKYSYNWDILTTFDDELYECGVVDSSYCFGKYLEKYCNNKEYLIRAINRNSNLFELLSHKLDEEDRMQLKNKLKEVRATNHLTDRIEKLSDEEKKDKELIIGHLKISPMSFPFIDPSLKNDIDVVMTAVTKHGGVLKFLSPEMKKNKEVVMASKHQGFAYADKTLQRDRQAILNAAQHYGGILELLDKDLRNDEEIVLQCIKTTPMSLEFASETLRNNPEIVRVAYNLDPKVVEFTDLVSF